MFAGTYFYLAHMWGGGRLTVSREIASWVPTVTGLSIVLLYVVFAISIAPKLFPIWLLYCGIAVIFITVELHSWFYFRRNGHFGTVIRKYSSDQYEVLRLAVLAHGASFIVFLVNGAYLMWKLQPSLINEMYLIPAITMPALLFTLVGIVLLTSKLIRVIRARLGYPFKGTIVSGRLLAGWVFISPSATTVSST